MSRAFWAATWAATLLACASCALPSQPDVPPVGVGLQDGSVVVLLPTCPGADVESVVVTPLHGDDFDPDESHAWRATGYNGPVARGVLLDASEWQTSVGPSPDWNRAFGIDLVVDGRDLGTVVYDGELSVVVSRPGEFLVEENIMTGEEFSTAFAPNGCQPRDAA